jgi:crossover junction endodeoxyribonuclease RuvC
VKLILGIDPGSLVTGYGLIRVEQEKLQYVDSGCIRIKDKKLTLRLLTIYRCIRELIELHQPTEAAIEEVFMHTNPGGALKLGQARGAAITAIVQDNIPVSEYSARQVKKSVVGTGAADKKQVQHMVTTLLKLNKTPAADAADALAIAICHANTQKSVQLMNDSNQYSRRRWQ